MSALATVSRQQKKAGEDAFLRFQVDGSTTALLPMKFVQEAAILSADRLTLMPNVPRCMLGLTNRRSRVLWVVDLAQFLGLSLCDINTRQYNLVIIRVGMVPLGLVVQQIDGIAWLNADQVHPPQGQLSPSLLPFIRGYALQSEQILLVLDAEAIALSPIFRQL